MLVGRPWSDSCSLLQRRHSSVLCSWIADGPSWFTCSLHHAPGLSYLLLLHGQQMEALRSALVYLHHHLNNHQHSRVKKAHIQTQTPFFIQKQISGRSFSSVVQSVQFSSVAQPCLTLCNPMDCSTAGFPVHHQLQEFTQTHVHWGGDAI